MAFSREIAESARYRVDIAVYLAVVPSMVAVTTLAAYVPALKASRIAPTLALRCD